ncbi:MAG: hypothetical protein Q7S81_00790 [bacterium]|nr:hypothetical protein [bacterium]
MPERVLIFGKLEDIIFVNNAEIKLLQDKIGALFDELHDPEDCALYNQHSGCRGCANQKQCEEAAKSYYVKKGELQEEINKKYAKIIILLHEIDFRDRGLPKKNRIEK